jgi:hypothetical protein
MRDYSATCRDKGRSACGGAVHVSIYSDGGDVPGSRLLSAAFDVPSGVIGGEWFGPSKLRWFLPEGTYWIVFEVDDQSTFSGGMLCCAPEPLGTEAFYSGFQGRWIGDDGINRVNFNDIGVRIDGNRGIPEPNTLGLIGLAVAGLGFAPRDWRAL